MKKKSKKDVSRVLQIFESQERKKRKKKKRGGGGGGGVATAAWKGLFTRIFRHFSEYNI